jgi:multidrug transporter EmrE-like cation transporter
MVTAVMHWTLILIAAMANVVLNLSLRQTARSYMPGSLGETLASVLLSPWAWLSVLSGAILVGTFAVAIRSFSLSLTYTAITAIAMVSLTLIGALLQYETVNLGRAVGLTLIVTGLVISALATT